MNVLRMSKRAWEIKGLALKIVYQMQNFTFWYLALCELDFLFFV